jgi:hypothetical protein
LNGPYYYVEDNNTDRDDEENFDKWTPNKAAELLQENVKNREDNYSNNDESNENYQINPRNAEDEDPNNA